MHVDISLQLAQLAASVMTGFALGIAYDLIRALRREIQKNTALDALFCAALLLTLFTLGMDIGQGGLHVFMLFAAGAGFAAYMALLSPFTLTLFVKTAKTTGQIFAPFGKLIKKFSAAVKKCFSKALNWYTIKKQSSKRRNGKRDEKIDDDRRTGIDVACRICYSEPGERKTQPGGRDRTDAAVAGGDPSDTGRERLP